MLDALVLRPRSKGDPKEPANWVVEYAISFFPVLLFVLVLRSFLVEPFQIPTGSMIPTLKVGDFILVNKYAYGIRLPVVGTKIIDVGDPERGDSMVFIPPHEEEYFIKRVIGLPGDRVRYQNKTLSLTVLSKPRCFSRRFEHLDRDSSSLKKRSVTDHTRSIETSTTTRGFKSG